MIRITFVALEKHYEQTIFIGNAPYNVDIVTEQSTNNISQPTVLIWRCDGRGSNFLAVPALLPFCENRTESRFLDVVAHEFGKHFLLNISLLLWNTSRHAVYIHTE